MKANTMIDWKATLNLLVWVAKKQTAVMYK